MLSSDPILTVVLFCCAPAQATNDTTWRQHNVILFQTLPLEMSLLYPYLLPEFVL